MRMVAVTLCLAALALPGVSRAEMALPEKTIQPPPPPGMPPPSGTYRDPQAAPSLDFNVRELRPPKTTKKPPKKKRMPRRR